jgi:hypothetical protein
LCKRRAILSRYKARSGDQGLASSTVVEDRAEAEVLPLDLLRSLTLLWHVTVS